MGSALSRLIELGKDAGVAAVRIVDERARTRDAVAAGGMREAVSGADAACMKKARAFATRPSRLDVLLEKRAACLAARESA